MTTENTNSQQPNSGGGEGATEAANPNVDASASAAGAGGQGNGGDQGKPDGGAGDGQPQAGAPEAYADFTLPEGFTLEGERKEAAQALFREWGFTQDRAQQAIDHFTKMVGEDSAVQKAAAEAASMQLREDWAKQAKAELGDKYDSEVALARTAVQAMQSEGLKQAFEQYHWGNHPELIKAFAFFGKMMRDSSVDGIGGAGAAPAKPNPWDAMYGDMHKK